MRLIIQWVYFTIIRIHEPKKRLPWNCVDTLLQTLVLAGIGMPFHSVDSKWRVTFTSTIKLLNGTKLGHRNPELWKGINRIVDNAFSATHRKGWAISPAKSHKKPAYYSTINLESKPVIGAGKIR